MSAKAGLRHIGLFGSFPDESTGLLDFEDLDLLPWQVNEDLTCESGGDLHDPCIRNPEYTDRAISGRAPADRRDTHAWARGRTMPGSRHDYRRGGRGASFW